MMADEQKIVHNASDTIATNEPHKQEGHMATYTLSDATAELIQLRQQEEAFHMRQAAVFSYVREHKLYKEANISWTQYCTDVVQYHYTTVVRRLRCYDNEAIREAYADLGAVASFTIATMENTLKAGPVFMDDEEARENTTAAIAAAKGKTVKQVQKYCQDLISTHSPEPTDSDTLAALVLEQKQLLHDIQRLQQELEEKNKRLNEVNAALAKVKPEK